MPNDPDDPDAADTPPDATGAQPKARKERKKRGTQKEPKPGAKCMNVTQLAHAWAKREREHASRKENNYYGLRDKACKYDAKGYPRWWCVDVVNKAIERRDAKPWAPGDPEPADKTSPEWAAYWKDLERQAREDADAEDRREAERLKWRSPKDQ